MPIIFENQNYEAFKELALKRLEEARCLLDSGHFSGAYYLAGYTIEMALKACYCKTVQAKSFPPEKNIYNSLYSHDLNKLLIASGTKRSYDDKISSNRQFASFWNVVKDWDNNSRYLIVSESDARSLINAVEDENDGVFNWIKSIW